MRINELLSCCKEKGIEIRCSDGKLKVSAPPGALTDDLKLALKQHKDALLSLLTKSSATLIKAVPEDVQQQGCPLSFAQKRLFFLAKLEKSNLYNVGGSFNVEGHLNLKALQQALEAIIHRHHILHTVYFEKDGEPLQKRLKDYNFQLDVFDYSQVDSVQHDSWAECHKAFMEKPFDLATDIMLRVAVVKLNAEQLRIMICMHHIAADGWSLSVFARELNRLYSAFVEGEDCDFAPLHIQYADFAYWQQLKDQDAENNSARKFWLNYLKGMPNVHQLPLDKPRPAQQTFDGDVYKSRISREQTNTFKKLSNFSGSTLFMGLHSVLALVLARYSEQQDIVIGTPIAGRDSAQLEPLIGCFVNTLLLRATIDPEQSFNELLKHTSKGVLQAFEYQQTPFDWLVEQLNPMRSLQYNPLFQIMFTLHNNEGSELNFSKVSFSPVKNESKQCKFDLTLDAVEGSDGLNLTWRFSTDIFDRATIARIDSYFTHFLQTVTSQPDTPIKALQQLPKAHQIEVYDNALKRFTDWQEATLQGQDCLAGKIVETLNKQANRVAIETHDSQLSYAELRREMQKWQSYLIAHKLNSGDRIGVFLKASDDLCIATLTLLTMGAVFVPLDPDYPRDRLEYMIQDAGLIAIITDNTLARTLPQTDTNILICNDANKTEITTDVVLQHGLPDAEAYVIYTSGSTGKPKGVSVSQKNALHYYLGAQNIYAVSEADRVLQFSSPSFDIFIEELLISVLSGATLVIPDQEERSGQLFWQSVATKKVTVASLPTAFWHMLCSELYQSSIPKLSLRLMITGGEKMSLDMLSKWQDCSKLKGINLLNTYGPTETTVIASTYDATGHQLGDGEIPIGKTVMNAVSFIIDGKGGLALPGAIGELVIAGPSVSTGYLNQPDSTNSAFPLLDKLLQNLPTELKSQRCYRTGDLVRQLPNNLLRFEGRADDQIKRSGYRITLGEIETQILRCKSAAAAAVSYDSENDQLAALIVPGNSSQLTESQLLQEVIAHVSATLPHFMRPALYGVAESIPLTQNGKTDNKQILNLATWLPAKTCQTNLSTATERRLAKLWATLLNVDESQLSKETQFFEIGGHSLLAAKLIHEIDICFGIKMNIRVVFETDSLAALSAQIEQYILNNRTTQEPATDNFISASNQTTAAASFAQRRLWYLQQLAPSSSHYNIADTVVFDLLLNSDIAERAVQNIVKKQSVLRTIFVLEDGELQQQILSEIDFKLDVLNGDDSRETSKSDIKKIMHTLSRKPFVLSRDLPIRVHLAHYDNQSIVMFCVHHIAADGWSVDLFWRLFKQEYFALLESGVSTIAAPQHQYIDYTLWQYQQIKNGLWQDQIDYWRNKLKDIPLVHDLTPDFSRPSEPDYVGESLLWQLPQSDLRLLKSLASQMQTSLFTVLHSAFALLLWRRSNSRDIVIGTPTANRSDLSTAELIGYFSNTLVLRTDVKPEYSLRQFVEQVKKVGIEAQEHQEVPFDYLVEVINPKRSLAINPLIQIVLTLEHLTGRENPIGNEYQFIENKVAKFDLGLHVKEYSNCLELEFNYCTALYSRNTLESLATQLTCILGSLANNVDTPLQRIQLQQRRDNRQFLQDTRGKSLQADVPRPLFAAEQVVDYFFKNVRQNPDKMAVACGNLSLSYEELNTASQQLLIDLGGIKQGEVVAVCLPRSIELAVIFTAVVNSKAIYLPVDHKAPLSRLEFIVDNAGADLLLTLPDSEINGEELRFQKICIQRQAKVSELTVYKSIDNQSLKPLPQDTAYCIYTSGSTGQPKGVVVSNEAILNTCRYSGIFDFSSIDAFLSTSNPAFDGSVFDLYNAFINGKGIVMIPHEQVVNFVYWTEQCQRYQANAALITTALFNLAVKQNSLVFELLKQVGIGGERASSDSVKQFLQSFSNSRLYNLYGPTETSVVATACELTMENAHSTPIGSAVCGNNAYVLDEDLQPVPTGCEGELCISGKGVGSGYIDLPEKTQLAFVTDPFASCNRVMYRTGDRVRVDHLGQLVFVGRMDEQVKIRGHRIELAEIEQHINKLAFVDHAIVTVCNNTESERLQCHIVLNSTEKLKANQQQWVNTISDTLNNALPDYMSPTAYGFVDRIPFTTNGKLDKKSLPEAKWVCMKSNPTKLTDVTQQELAKLWSQVLNVEFGNICADSDFFNLGGHSLLVVKLKVAIEQHFAVEVAISDLFNSPLLADMARLLVAAKPVDKQKQTQLLKPTLKQFTASAAQRSIWLIDQMVPGSTHYTIQFAIDTDIDFDLSVAKNAIVAVIIRHEPLRTVFAPEGENVQQRILDAQEIELVVEQQFHETSCTSEKHQIVTEMMTEMSMHQFQLDKDLLLQALHIQFNDGKGVLIFNTHHIAFDGWSKRLFCQDFKEAYASLQQQDHICWSQATPIRYIDYSAWQQEYLVSPAGKAGYQYWKEQLFGAPVRHSLPMLEAGRHKADTRGKSMNWLLPENAISRLEQIAQANQVSHFMVMHTVLCLTMSAFSGETDIVIGTPMANRSRKEHETAVGLFINTVALRIELSGCKTISDLLKTIKTTNLDALSHQAIPFEHVVDAINPQRDSAYMPLFQVLFTMDEQLQKLPDGKFDAIEYVTAKHNCQEKFDFSMHVTPATDNVGITLNYRESLFCPELMVRFARTFNLIFSQLESNLQLDQLVITSVQDRACIYGIESEKNPGFVSLSDAFELQADKTPDAVALVYENEPYTFAWVNRTANLLARQLLVKGIGSEQLVGVCLERSPLHIISLLAVLKCGASYVPLDPDYPKARLEYIVEDAAIRWVISDTPISQKWATLPVEFIIPELLYADELGNASNLSVKVSASSLAYIIYTSGTTGNPKGVMIEQGNAMEMLRWAKQTYTQQQLSGVLMSTSICFDLSVFETFLPLITGGTCMIVDHILDTAQYAENSNFPVTLINTVPSAMVQLLEQGLVPKSVQVINLAGEALTKQVVDNAYRQTQVELVYNLYGPSEDTTYSTFYLCERNSHRDPRIGKPINGCEAYVLDKYGRIVPFGVKGELFLAGTGLSRGYINKSALTHQKFVKIDLQEGNAKRLYRTGDLVSMHPSDGLQFIGRNDQQVKLNGYRIELGDIESTLTRLKGIKRAAVIVSSASEYQHLLGFVELESTEQNEMIDEVQLKASLFELLPVYMVPRHVYIIGSMPLNLNGKIDREKLRKQYAKTLHSATSQNGDGLPATAVEKQIASIWQQILKVEQVMLDDNFFTIGGRSLLAIQAVNEMNNSLGWNLTLTEMFKFGTIKAIVNHSSLNNAAREAGEGKLLGLRNGSLNSHDHVIFIHPAGGDILCYEPLIALLDKNWHIHGLCRAQAHGNSIELMAKQYACAIANEGLKGNLHLVGYSFGGTLAFEIARQLGSLFDENCTVNLIDSMISQESSKLREPNKHALLLMLSEQGEIESELLASIKLVADNKLSENLPQILAMAKAMKLFPEALALETVQRQLQVYASNLNAFYRYQGGSFAYPVNLLIAEDSRIALSERGWLKHTQVASHNISANHFNVLEAPYLERVAEWLLNSINLMSTRSPAAHEFSAEEKNLVM